MAFTIMKRKGVLCVHLLYHFLQFKVLEIDRISCLVVFFFSHHSLEELLSVKG